MTLMLIQHRGSKFEGFITLSPEHARKLFAPRFAAYFTQLSKGATASYFFHHHELGCRRRRHGRQMGNAKHLMAFRQLTHTCADGVGDFAADVRVNLVEDKNGTASCAARADLIASINREISPLEAI